MPNEFYDTKEGQRLIIHAGKDNANTAYAYFSDDTITIADPTGTMGISIAKDYGTAISGPLSIIADPSQIRVATLWKINPLVTTSLPSTLFTPTSWLKQDIPTSATELVKGLTEIAVLLAV